MINEYFSDKKNLIYFIIIIKSHERIFHKYYIKLSH